MSTTTAGRTGDQERPDREESWYAALGDRGRKAFRAAFAGYSLDAFDLIILRARRGDHGLARADVHRHPARAADPLHPPQRAGRRGLRGDQARGRGRRARRGEPAQADLPRRPGTHHDRRVRACDRHPGRLLRDVHLDPDLPQGGARPHRGRDQRLPVRRGGGRVLRLPDRRLRARPTRAQEDLRTVLCGGGHLPRRLLRGPERLEPDPGDRRLPARVLRLGLLLGLRLLPVRAVPDAGARTGGGFCYNVGRGFGALFPGIIGFLAAAVGLGGAVAFGVFGYVLAISALAFLPETHGKELVAD